MKVFVVIFALCVSGALGGLTDEQKAVLKGYRENCIAETGVDPVLVMNAGNGQIIENDRKFECFAACLLRHIGIFDAQGVLHEDVVLTRLPADLPREKGEELISRCRGLATSGGDICHTGGALFACYQKHKTFTVNYN